MDVSATQVDCDDLIDSPLWEEFICALHRLLFSEIDSMGGLVDCDENEVLIKVRHTVIPTSILGSCHKYLFIYVDFAYVQHPCSISSTESSPVRRYSIKFPCLFRSFPVALRAGRGCEQQGECRDAMAQSPLRTRACAIARRPACLLRSLLGGARGRSRSPP